jgi:hypothetical protein
MVLATVITTMLLLVLLPASAQPPSFDAFDFTRNLHHQGFSPNPDTINSDLAFLGNLAFHGDFNGFASSTSAPPPSPPGRLPGLPWQSR